MRRRDVLAGAGVAACAAMLGGGGHLPSLCLHSQDLQPDGTHGHWRQVRVLTQDGFTATSALLVRSGPCRIVAVLNDADALIIDRMLSTRGARDLTMRRTGAAFLLTATL